jgi:P-type E1-E2 ATPase
MNVISGFSAVPIVRFHKPFLLAVLIKSGRYVPSSELVPGDVYEVTDPALTQFPCDSILLTGDCIVNESMLTGKSLKTQQYKN